ncbi:MAG TPA: hypothetical protein VKI44_28945 [Acetobacteraceae bacterium]|nr:hypothetical protein [Acetobacteraceae bacterium]
MRLFRFVALCLLLLPPCGARADDIGPVQAQALDQQLKDWLAGLLGPSVKLPELPWRITGERDHYVITWPIPSLTSSAGEVATTANVRPLGGGRWAIDGVQMPPSGSFTMTIPDASAPGNSAPVQVEFTIGKQDTNGVIDPGLATASTLHTEVSDVMLSTDSLNQRQEQRFDRYLGDIKLAPAQNGRLDLTQNATVHGWKSASQIMGGTPVAIGIQTMRGIGRIKGVNRDRVAALLAATGSLIGALPPDIATKEDKTDLPAPARAQLRLLVESLQDMLTEVSVEETLDGLQVEIAGMGGLSMQHFLLGFGGEAPEGRLHAWVDIGLDELTSPSLPPNVAAFLPHRVEIKPSLSGVLTADLHKLALDATEEGADSDSLEPDVAAIFSRGGVNLGVETLSFDLGPAKFEGTGHVTALSPDTWHGEAHVVAAGFDDLVAKARTNPDLQQALPVLIMLRGLAKPDRKRLVWDIVSDGPTVTVNGLDLSQLGGGDKPKGKPGQRPSR